MQWASLRKTTGISSREFRNERFLRLRRETAGEWKEGRRAAARVGNRDVEVRRERAEVVVQVELRLRVQHAVAHVPQLRRGEASAAGLAVAAAAVEEQQLRRCERQQ
eukprot:3899735-Pleurochrysis_carterae.AAC.1